MKRVKFIPSDNCYLFDCPHCNLSIQVQKNEVNCEIFRHGIIKKSGLQVNPHASKEHCDRLTQEGLVYGCCKPFRLVYDNNIIKYVDKCDYI